MKLEHFNKQEHDFVIKMTDFARQVYDSHQIKRTKFLTPREQEIVQIIVGSFDEVMVYFEGGFQNAERKRAILLQNYLTPTFEDAQLKGYEISYSNRFIHLEHRQVLGSLMSLNIDRSLIGDIVMNEEGNLYFAICEEMSSLVEQEMTKIGSQSVNLIPINISEIKRIEKYEENECIIKSMRLDVIVATIMNASRSEVAEYIKQGNIQLNFKVEQNHSRLCQISDMISIRRYGRYKLLSQKSMTKSGRLVVIIGKII